MLNNVCKAIIGAIVISTFAYAATELPADVDPGVVIVGFNSGVEVNKLSPKMSALSVSPANPSLATTSVITNSIIQKHGAQKIERVFKGTEKLRSMGILQPPIHELENKYKVRAARAPKGAVVSGLSNVYKFVFPVDVNVLSVIEEIKKDPNVAFAEPSYKAVLAVAPNDPDFSKQWYLQKIQAPFAWNISRGSEKIIVAVIDTGVDYTHEDLGGNIWHNGGEIPNNGIDDDGNGYIDDTMGWDFSDGDNNPMDAGAHGTHVAGIVSAVTNNSIGISSIGYKAKIMALKIYNNAYADIIAKAIEYAADNGADVISCSWLFAYQINEFYFGPAPMPESVRIAIDYAISKGCLIVFAAGNWNNSEKYYPAAYDKVIAVAATDQNDQKASFSNYGDWIDISAPGVPIYSTVPGNKYEYKGGTSMSTPLVSGTAALILSINPSLSCEELKNILYTTATDLGGSGFDQYFGNGRIDAYKAIIEVVGKEPLDYFGGTPPGWIKNICFSDIAVDEYGNKYVLCHNVGNPPKSVVRKYDRSWNQVWERDSFSGTQLNYPLGIAISPVKDSDGAALLLVADTFNNRILMFKDYGTSVISDLQISGPRAAALFVEKDVHTEKFWGLSRSGEKTDIDTVSATNEGFFLPTDVAFLNGAEFAVTDYGNNRVTKYNYYTKKESGVTVERGLVPAAFDQVIGDQNGIFVDKMAVVTKEVGGLVGRQFVGGEQLRNTSGGTIIGAFLGGPVGAILGGLISGILTDGFEEKTKLDKVRIKSNVLCVEGGKYLFSAPTGVASGLGKDIYISDNYDNSIKRFNLDGTFSQKYGDDTLSGPWGVTLDNYGNLFVADAANKRVVQFGPDNKFVKEYKSETNNISPLGLDVKDNNIYIAMSDQGYARPLVWSVGGEIGSYNVAEKWLSPNSDGAKDSTQIMYSLSQPADVSIQLIPKPSGAVSAMGVGSGTALDKVARNIGANTEIWDGYILGGVSAMASGGTTESTTIPDGAYSLKLLASFGDYVKTKTADIYIDNTKPSISLDRAPPAISPNNDGVKDVMTINYSLADNLSLTAEAKLTLWKNNHLVDILLDKPETISSTATAYSLTWDGKVAGYVIEGKYTLKLEATDLAVNTAVATQDVTVDRQPPRIEAVKLSSPYFSPNGDGRKDNTEICFVLSDNYATTMPTTVLIENSQGAEVARIANRINLAAGEYCFTWEGASLPDGNYQARIYAEDDAGNIGTCEPQAVAIDTVPPTVESFAAAPNPFTPNDDGVNDWTVFSYKLSEPCNTELKIFREDQSTLFRDYRQYDITSGSFKWDGTGFHGEILGENHPFSLYAEDRAGNVTTSESQIIVVDHAPSLVPYAFAEPDPFSPVNPKNSTTTIRYFLTRDGLTVNAAITGKEGRVVKQLVKDEVQNKGEHTVSWDGGFDPSYDGPRASGNNNRVADGAWEIKVTATASDEPKPCLTSNTVLVDNVPPFIMADPVAIDLVNRKATLTYSVPERSTVEVAVYDQGQSLVKALSNAIKTAGTYTATWHATAADKNLTYFKVTAVDRALNETEKKSELFAIIPQENLQITGLNAIPATFTPNGDGLLDQTRFTYHLSGGAPEYQVNIMVQTETGSTVKTIVQNDPQNSGTYSFYWEGKNDAGIIAPDGHYRCVIDAADKLGANIKGEVPVLLVATKPTVSLTTSLPTFSPNGDGSKDTVDLNYSINYATLYVSGEGLVKLEVLNTSSEAVWSKVFNNTAGSYIYQYNGTKDDGAPLPTGEYYVKISGQDALNGTAIQKTIPLTVDYSSPEPTDFAVSHTYAKLGDEITIALSFPEPLAEDPTVKFNSKDGATKTALLTTKEANNYTYNYTIAGEDTEGPATVSVEARDLAFNPIHKSKSLTIDKTNPVVSVLSVMPNPASTPEVSGQVSIKFSVSEPLKMTPKVYVTQNGAAPQLLPVSGLYEAKYNVITGYDGPALITVEVVDLANNESRLTIDDSLLIDTIAPAFSSLECEIANNPEYNKQAKEGTTATLRFKTSEPLKFNPEVRVNDNPAVYDSLTSNEYTYKYDITNTDTNGTAEITISGYDYAGNPCEKISVSAESFVIDLVNPTVAIASPESEMIATPSPFQTNGKPGIDNLQTMLNYEISEPGYVTVSVHKVTNNQETYLRTDFTADNQVAKFTKGWESAGAHFANWDGRIGYNQAEYDKNSNGFADPGKYAFIVDVRDRAGNLIEGKWGGTCWIQDNVLDLIKSDKGEDNPSPLYFSPNGDGSLESTTAYFRVTLGITPAECKRPERISVFGVQDIAWNTVEVKAIGTYTVRVYNSDKSQLIKTICENEALQSNKVTPVVWDGRNSAGNYVSEGTYLIEVDARDFLGGQAMNNLLTLTATVDSTAPRIVSAEPNLSGTSWRNGSTTYTYNVDFFDDQNAFASKLARAEYRLGTTGTWETIFYDLNDTAYMVNWGSELFAKCGEGTTTVYVRAQDRAGNLSAATTALYVKKDTGKPTGIWLKINGEVDAYTDSTTVNLTMGATDVTSGVSKVVINNDSGSWSSEKDPGAQSWTLNNVEGARTVTIKFKDNAGNWSDTDSKTINFRTLPVINNLSVSNASFNPYSATSSTAISFNAADSPASLQAVTARIKLGSTVIKEWLLGTSGSYSFDWNGTNSYGDYVNEGTYTLELVATDNANNSTTYNSQTITVWDDVNISNNSADSTLPVVVQVEGSSLNVKWVEGYNDNRISPTTNHQTGPNEAWVDSSSNVGATDDYSNSAPPFTIDHGQTVDLVLWSENSVTENRRSYEIKDNTTNNIIWSNGDIGANNQISVSTWLNPGTYYLRVRAGAPGLWCNAKTDLKIWYDDRKFNQYAKASQDSGKTWSNAGQWPNIVDGQPSQQVSLPGKNYVHSVYVEDSALWYRRQQGDIFWKAKLTNVGIATNPSLSVDANTDNCYVVWEYSRNGNKDIYFQKIPVNFAKVSGTPDSRIRTAAIKPGSIVQQSITFEVPALLAPTDKTENVRSIRPVFEWTHHKGDTTEYRIDVAKNDLFTMSNQSFSKSPNSGSPDSADPALFNYTYAIHEFDPGLGKATYYWKVTALTTNEAATSEVWSFTIQPDLTLTDITNYPNPFSPNREKTTIRYKLGADADEVKIRIYDITGLLVTELDGTTNGEGTSIWSKYNDIDWDGRNGRGDMVMNGIYPYEVMARLGDKSLSGRGKIAVLK